MSEDKKKYTLSPVHYIRDDMLIEAGEFKTASSFADKYIAQHNAEEPEFLPSKLEAVSLRIPSHLHNVIKSNAQCFGMSKTQFMIQALEVGINEIFEELNSHGVELSTDGFSDGEDS